MKKSMAFELWRSFLTLNVGPQEDRSVSSEYLGSSSESAQNEKTNQNNKRCCKNRSKYNGGNFTVSEAGISWKNWLQRNGKGGSWDGRWGGRGGNGRGGNHSVDWSGDADRGRGNRSWDHARNGGRARGGQDLATGAGLSIRNGRRADSVSDILLDDAVFVSRLVICVIDVAEELSNPQLNT